MAEDFLDRLTAKPERAAPPRLTPVTIPDGVNATRYAQAALAGEVENLLAVPIGSGRNHQLNISAMKMGQLVGLGHIDEQTVVETLGAADGGLHYKPTRDTIASGLRAGITQGRIIPEPSKREVAPWETSTDPFSDSYNASSDTVNASPPPATTPNTGEKSSTASATDNPADSTDDDQARRAALVHVEAARIRLQRQARRVVDHEDALAQFRPPEYTGTLTDELALPDEPVEYVVDEIFPTGANVLLAAQFKAGKTTLVNNLAKSFADGEKFLGRYTVTPPAGRVALFNYEVSRGQYRKWLRDTGFENTDRVTTLPLRGVRLPLNVPYVEDWVVEYLKRHQVSVWIIDPFARASTGIDENSNSEVGVWLDTLDVIKERAGVTELVLPTHTGRAEWDQGDERARGATRLDDWADVRWLLTKDKAEQRFFRATGRDVDVDETALAFDTETRRFTATGGDRRTVLNTRYRDAVLTVIQNNPGVGVTTLRTGVRQIVGTASQSLVESAIDELIYARQIHIRPDGKVKGHWPGPPAYGVDPFQD